MTIRIGTSGWSYDHWAGVLYPVGTSQAKRLTCYTSEFDTVELNASFYRWPRDATFEGWRRRLPDGFAMTVKAHRGLTHFRRLNEPQEWVERFTRCWAALGDRAGVLLVQLHPNQRRDDERLGHFLGSMPESIRTAVELRHPSWNDPAVFELLRHHRAAYVVTSGASMPCVPCVTTDLAYVRLHGPPDEPLYEGSYTDAELDDWARRISNWDTGGIDVYVYFNNDLHGHAVRNARTLKALLATR